MIRRRAVLCVVVTGCAAVFTSCGWPHLSRDEAPGAAVAAEAGATSQTAVPPPAKPDPAALREYTAGTPRQPQKAVVVEHVWIGRDHSAMYEVEDTDGALGDGRMTLQGDSDSWNYARLGQRIEKLEAGEDGSLMLRELDNIEKGVIIRFNPPVMVVPARLEPGKPVTTTARMTILERADPTNVRSSGKMKVTVVYDATQTLNTPAGRFDCHRVRLNWDADFGFGSTHSAITCYYNEKVGLVAEDYQSRTTILLFKDSRQITAVMSKPPQPLTAAVGAQ